MISVFCRDNVDLWDLADFDVDFLGAILGAIVVARAKFLRSAGVVVGKGA